MFSPILSLHSLYSNGVSDDLFVFSGVDSSLTDILDDLLVFARADSSLTDILDDLLVFSRADSSLTDVCFSQMLLLPSLNCRHSMED